MSEKASTTSLTELLADQPPEYSEDSRGMFSLPNFRLVVLDDDPTGTQSVAELPVLTTWKQADFEWAFSTSAAAVYVLTNSRSLTGDDAAAINREVVMAAMAAAEVSGVRVGFVSRSDSTLRGHFPVEPDAIAEQLSYTDEPLDGIILAPAFPDAGRITINSVHYSGSLTGGFIPVGDTEFAQDATFGFSESHLPRWIEEATAGRVSAASVVEIPLTSIRSGPDAVRQILMNAPRGAYFCCDSTSESDLQTLGAGIRGAIAEGRSYIYRVGPAAVRALIGQQFREPLSPVDVNQLMSDAPQHGGLVVVGSHVALTTRQLADFQARRSPVVVEIDVHKVLSPDCSRHLQQVVSDARLSLLRHDVVLRTSRHLVTGRDPAASLEIARSISDALVSAVKAIVSTIKPRFLVAKGGITSSDVATKALGLTRATVRGTMLHGLVSVWEPSDGLAPEAPYIVFAGNVGDDDSLTQVIDKLSIYSDDR